MIASIQVISKGAFTNYVDKILAFFDHPSIDIFYGINVDKKSIFLTTYPPTLVNVVCECPLFVVIFMNTISLVNNFVKI